MPKLKRYRDFFYWTNDLHWPFWTVIIKIRRNTLKKPFFLFLSINSSQHRKVIKHRRVIFLAIDRRNAIEQETLEPFVLEIRCTLLERTGEVVVWGFLELVLAWFGEGFVVFGCTLWVVCLLHVGECFEPILRFYQGFLGDCLGSEGGLLWWGLLCRGLGLCSALHWFFLSLIWVDLNITLHRQFGLNLQHWERIRQQGLQRCFP